MHQELAFVEWAESAGHRIAKPDYTQQLVGGRIDDRNRV
jgi:hypothetical protein